MSEITNKEFLERITNIDSQINALYKEKKLMFQNRIEALAEFKPLDKVVLNDGRKECIAFVRSIGCHDSGVIYYSFNECKRDGTMSKNRFNIGLLNGYTIKKFDQ